MLHQVGVGALGPVFRTYEPTRDRLVAVKVFRLDITPEQAQSLADALSVAADAGLFHPSIVEPIAAGVEGTVAYRAEEYVAAESLDVALRHYAPAPMSRVLPFVAQLAGAIDFARTAGVGHGALHPRDIFVTPDEVRATGFGVVEALEGVGLRAPVRRPYSAPERVAAQPWGAPADVFSLAAIAYELITGRRPAGTGTQIGPLDSVGRDRADLVHAVLARAMSEQPQDRYPSALAFASALDEASEGRSTEPVVAPAVVAAAPAVVPAATSPAETAETVIINPGGGDNAGAWDDISGEREADEAFVADAAGRVDDDEEIAASDEDTSIGDDETDEAVEDLALDPRDDDIERFAEEFTAAAREPAPESVTLPQDPAADDEPVDRYLGLAPASAPLVAPVDADEPSMAGVAYREREPAAAAHRSGPSWTWAALLVGLALLVGFAAGQMIGPAAPVAPTGTAVAQQPAPQNAAPASGTERPPSVAPAPAPVATTPPPATAPPPAPVPAKPEAARTGSLRIRSSPSGASVTLNGKWTGRTPLTLEGLAFGTHEIRVVQQGYAVVSEDVALSAGSPARTLSLTLERTPAAPTRSARTAKPDPAAKPAAPAKPQVFTGTLYVDSLPRGAEVFVNGRAVGTTPVLVPDVPVGSQVVRLQLEDHRTWSTGVRVVAGQQIKVSGSLDRIR